MIFSKIKEAFSSGLNNIFKSNSKDIDEKIDEIEELLILSDIGVDMSVKICDELRKKLKSESEITDDNVRKYLKEIILDLLSDVTDEISLQTSPKKVILVVGVNGVGKTTSIAKLSKLYIESGRKVLLAAADTFRAGATEQLQLWAEVINTKCIIGKNEEDPSSVIFEATKEFNESQYDTLICDSAGRLHTKKNLMDEIEKMKRIIDRNVKDAEIEVLMVIDATTGQNAVEQVKAFYDSTDVDGIIFTKLDSTAKGGIVLNIMSELKIPIKYIGYGEKIDDIKTFNKEKFVESII